MIGSNHSKVALIERRDLADVKPLGESDHGGVSRTQRKIVGPGDQLSHPVQVLRLKIDEFESSPSYGLTEGGLDCWPYPLLKHVPHFRNDRRRHEEPASR